MSSTATLCKMRQASQASILGNLLQKQAYTRYEHDCERPCRASQIQHKWISYIFALRQLVSIRLPNVKCRWPIHLVQRLHRRSPKFTARIHPCGSALQDGICEGICIIEDVSQYLDQHHGAILLEHRSTVEYRLKIAFTFWERLLESRWRLSGRGCWTRSCG